jgi:hemerythrin-like domain-containing protein
VHYEEYVRFAAYGNQLIQVHARLRDLLDDLRDGVVPEPDFAAHCVTFCAAVTEHHTGEDETVFPLLAERHPELRDFLAELRRDHEIIAGLLSRLRSGDEDDLDGLAAVLETHFRGEEKRLTEVLNAVEPSAGLRGLGGPE